MMVLLICLGSTISVGCCVAMIARQAILTVFREQLRQTYDEILLAAVHEPSNHELLALCREAGMRYYDAILPGAYSRYFHALYPLRDIYDDYQSLVMGLLHADFIAAAEKGEALANKAAPRPHYREAS